jgi:hypothetical protein
MNVGLRETHDLAERVSTALKSGSPAVGLDDYDRERRMEWRSLLGIDGHPEARGDAPGWAAQRADRIVPCIPASGGDLARLLEQIGLKLP